MGGFGEDILPTAFSAGVFSMLVALFTLSMRAILQTGDRADKRSDAEIERLHEQIKQREISHQKELTDAKNEEAFWRERYLDLLAKGNHGPQSPLE